VTKITLASVVAAPFTARGTLKRRSGS